MKCLMLDLVKGKCWNVECGTSNITQKIFAKKTSQQIVFEKNMLKYSITNYTGTLS